MAFRNPYVIVRLEEGGQVKLVKASHSLKDVKYWLNYIAEPGDAIFLTPAHPKYDGGTGVPTYNSHLVKRGQVEYDKGKWEAAFLRGRSLTWPESDEGVQ